MTLLARTTFLMVLLLFSISVFSNKLKLTTEERRWLDAHQVITFSIECNYAPIIYENNLGKPRGLSIDFVKEIESILNIEFQYNKCKTLPDLLKTVKNRKTDLISSIKNTEERRKYMIFSNPYIEIPTVIITPSKINTSLDIDKLSDYKIGIGEESGLYHEIKRLYPEYKLQAYKTEQECLKRLFLNDVDIVLTDAASYSYFIEDYKVDKFYVSNIIPFSYSLCFGSSIGNDTLIQIINKAISKIPDEKKKKIYLKWIKFDVNKKIFTTKTFYTITTIVIAFFIIFIAVLIWNRLLNKKVEAKTQLLNNELLNREKKQRELILLNKKLKEAKERAEESEKLKTAFLANMSHEIRTPMNGIIGFSYLLERDDLSFDQKKEYTRIIISSGKQLISVIDDIIEISYIDSNQIKINNSRFNLRKFCNEIHYELTALIPPEKNIQFTFDNFLFDEEDEITTDRVKLKQIISNLINNAIKYTHQGEISCSCKLNNNNSELLINVKDTGIGIAKDNLEIIFERFRQIETPKFFQSGSGLGLSIVKSYSELLGGKIWVESELNSGSTFYLSIPVALSRIKEPQNSI
ncbi:MAG: transporter substrate-binding domain-containing protein [Bacteroidales bacterium]|nr:transporter substrate-binding domain-containing protein [Bacteroidales bacterium]